MWGMERKLWSLSLYIFGSYCLLLRGERKAILFFFGILNYGRSFWAHDLSLIWFYERHYPSYHRASLNLKIALIFFYPFPLSTFKLPAKSCKILLSSLFLFSHLHKFLPLWSSSGFWGFFFDKHKSPPSPYAFLLSSLPRVLPQASFLKGNFSWHACLAPRPALFSHPGLDGPCARGLDISCPVPGCKQCTDA